MADYIEYNFPETIFVRQNTPGEQLDHVLSEAFEIIEEVMATPGDLEGAAGDEKVLLELVDKYHALETLFRIKELELGPQYVADLFARCEAKNRARGYYA